MQVAGGFHSKDVDFVLIKTHQTQTKVAFASGGSAYNENPKAIHNPILAAALIVLALSLIGRIIIWPYRRKKPINPSTTSKP